MQEYFRHLNGYYDEIYVLSVKHAEKRRKVFEERFKGLDYSFFFGADKKEFSTEDLVEKNIYNETLTKKNHRYSKLMMQGEIACAWSHKLVYEDVLQKNYERVLIFEDDAVPDTE